MTLTLAAPPFTASLTLAGSRRARATLAGVVLAHAGLLAMLLVAPRAPAPIAPPQPLTVRLITPEVEPPQPKTEPKLQPPQPAAQPLPPPPVLVAERPVPVPVPVVEAPKPAPAPMPVPEVLPAPAPRPEPAPAPVQPPAPASPALPPRPADYLVNPKPPYPSLSKRLGEEGTVRLKILVNPDGSVARLELVKSSGFPRLDQSAIETIQSSWKFHPGTQDGKPIPAWVTVPIEFTLRS